MFHRINSIVALSVLSILMQSCTMEKTVHDPGSRVEIHGDEARIYGADRQLRSRSAIHSGGATQFGEYTVIPTDNLLVTGPSNRLRYQIEGLSSNDPRSLLYADGALVFTMGSVAIANYQLQDVDGVLQWLTANRKVFAIELDSGKLVWGGSEVEMGTPIAVIKGDLVTLRAASPRHFLSEKKGRGRFILCKQNIRSRADSATFEFEISTSDPRYSVLVDTIFGIDTVAGVTIDWKNSETPRFSIRGVSISGSPNRGSG